MIKVGRYKRINAIRRLKKKWAALTAKLNQSSTTQNVPDVVQENLDAYLKNERLKKPFWLR